jgi:hypothetical protein
MRRSPGWTGVYSLGGAWLTNDDANHRIALLVLPGLFAPVDTGDTAVLYHIAFEYDTFDQWLDNYLRLAADGTRPFLNLDHGMMRARYYQTRPATASKSRASAFGGSGEVVQGCCHERPLRGSSLRRPLMRRCWRQQLRWTESRRPCAWPGPPRVSPQLLVFFAEASRVR